jgi:hypothetical protein
MYVPEVSRRRRPVLVRRRAVRRAGRQEVATGNLRDPREVGVNWRLDTTFTIPVPRAVRVRLKL